VLAGQTLQTPVVGATILPLTAVVFLTPFAATFLAPRFVDFTAAQRSVTPEPRDKKPELQVHVDDMAFETLFAGQDVQGPPENEYMFAGQLKHCVALD